LQGSQGAAVLAGETTKNSLLASKGYYVPEQWDVYWTSTKVGNPRVRCVAVEAVLSSSLRMSVRAIMYWVWIAVLQLLRL
jgi:hypothetical protein